MEQAERYLHAIRDACEALADGRRRGQSIDAIRPGYRKLASGSHFLFFRATDRGEIEIIRILHQKMDVPRHLGS